MLLHMYFALRQAKRLIKYTTNYASHYINMKRASLEALNEIQVKMTITWNSHEIQVKIYINLSSCSFHTNFTYISFIVYRTGWHHLLILLCKSMYSFQFRCKKCFRVKAKYSTCSSYNTNLCLSCQSIIYVSDIKFQIDAQNYYEKMQITMNWGQNDIDWQNRDIQASYDLLITY